MNYSQDNTTKIKKQIKSKKKKAKNKASVLTFRIILIVVLITGFAAAGGLIGAYFGIIQGAPKLEPISVMPNIYTTILYDSKGNEVDRLRGEENREYVTFNKIPQNLKNAIISIEDERFYQHDGVDYRGMVRIVYLLLTENIKQGASTITQQLIKNSLKIPRNTLITKLQEQYLAVQYEKGLYEDLHSKQAVKDYILELYLNTIALSHGLNGVQTAAFYYFNKEVGELNLSECAVIAAITQNPTKYSPIINPDNNRVRRDVVLDQMLKLGYINEDEHKAAIEDDVYSRISESEQITALQESFHSYFVDQAILEVHRDLQNQLNMGSAEAFNYIYNAGLQIHMTQDTEMQNIMDESFRNDDFFPSKDFKIEIQYFLSVKNNISDKTTHYNRRGTVETESEIDAWIDTVKRELVGTNDEIIAERYIPIPQPQAAMIVMDHHNGHVKAMTGGRGEKMTNLALNRAVDSERSPGSVFKVLASFAPAIDMGLISPSTIIVDEPYTYNNYTPSNWYTGYRGPSSVRDGIRNSMNILAVKNMVSTGIDACMDYLVNFGFTTLVTETTYINGTYRTDRGAATALGGLTHGVNQVELCAAYATIANEGEYNKPVFYTKVIDHDGRPILENEPEPRQVLKKASAYVLTDMMKSVITAGTGGKAAFKNSKMPLSGKTGTSQETKDLIFAGYTPYYTASIWLGFDQPETITQETEGFHLRLWSDVMEKIHTGLPTKQFEKPDGVVTASVCSDSGKLAVASLCENDVRGDRIITDIFMVGTQPTEYCDSHIKIDIDSVSYKRFGSECPAENREQLIGVINRSPDAVLSPDSAWSIPENFLASPECDEHGHYTDPFISHEEPVMPDTQSGYQSFESLYGNPSANEQDDAAEPPSGTNTSDSNTAAPSPVTPLPPAITSQPVMPTATPRPTPTAVPAYTRSPAR